MKLFLSICFAIINFELVAQDSITYPIYFEYKVAQLDTNEMKTLKTLLGNFSNYKIGKIKIVAFCDDRGKKKYNDTLSSNRANAIVEFIQANIKSKEEVGYYVEGKGHIPLESKENIEEQRAKNRRGELTLYYTKLKDSSKKKDKVDTIINRNKPAQEKNIRAFISNAKVGDKLKLKVTFFGGRHRLFYSSRAVLDSLVGLMAGNEKKFDIQGHIFNRGVADSFDGLDVETGTYDLSKQRAYTVYKYLIDKGIDKSRLSYKGFGARFPLGNNPEQDRRVELVMKE